MAGNGQVISCHKTEEWREHFDREKNSQKLTWTHVLFLKVDVDELKEVAEEYKVEAMPTFLFIKEGKVIDTVVGARKDELHAAIKKHSAAV
ncbi:hypothetical protein V2J09_011678 [Rumex salicifolius]